MTFKKKLVAAGTVAVLAVGTLLAQPSGPRHRFGEKRDRLEFIATYLDLTDGQKEQAKALIDAAREANKPLRDQLRENHQSMAAAVKANKPETELKPIADAQGALIAQLSLSNAKTAAQLYALLTPEQQSKADKLHGQFMNMVSRRMDARHLRGFKQPAGQPVNQ